MRLHHLSRSLQPPHTSNYIFHPKCVLKLLRGSEKGERRREREEREKREREREREREKERDSGERHIIYTHT
jgi:hypothetical protein